VGGDGNVFLGGSSADQLWSWCVEPGDYLRPRDTYTVRALESSTVGQIASRSSAITGLVGALFDFETGSFTANALSAAGGNVRRAINAFQAALWELTTEDDIVGRVGNASGRGSFYLDYLAGSDDSNVISLADTWIASAMDGAFAPSERVNLYILETDGGQSQLAATVVPIPGAVWLFGSGLLILAGFNSRKPRRA
jgi:hypothetical protein